MRLTKIVLSPDNPNTEKVRKFFEDCERRKEERTNKIRKIINQSNNKNMKIETKKEIRSDVSQLAIELAKVLSFIDYEQVFHLSKRESFVLKSRLSLKSIEQIGDELDLTRERTRQILVKSIHILNRRVNYMVFLCEEAKKDREIAEKTKEEITQMRLNGFQESFKYGILPIRNFYGELSVRTINCLKNIDIEFLDELAKTSKKELLRTRNLGKKSIDELADLMHKHGLYFQK
jgi:hypothetical protein